jgi:hypothetical protein
MTMVDNLEFPWQPDSPIPWREQSYDFTDNTDVRFITADVTRYGDVAKPWLVYAAVHLYQSGESFHLRDAWYASAAEGKAAAEAHIREHAS